MTAIKVTRYFEMQPEEQEGIKLRTLPRPCPDCDATGKCTLCAMPGYSPGPHQCDCEYCGIRYIKCPRCDGKGMCGRCRGRKVTILHEREIRAHVLAKAQESRVTDARE